ncbi:ornithine cyclodeaminase [Hartmannibacter diazotrophicus]|uniref:Ornithine cyclodeaminase n=1 Tax=Hartmannibacter diazotrophicus TaxID=1482074 RepID=A0A2C9DCW0_9HYPH|nr:ornithine cyclodeaminase family protein [Hartmannibacter diazotrophicus]SON58010.1 ornithine cyclodeaminase [Hartmannibacter diazotrophicus]
MRVVTTEETAASLPYPALVEGLRAAFRSGMTAPLRHHHVMPREGEPDAVLLLMPAWAGNGTFGGVKLVNVTPGNSARGLPAVIASYLLFSEVTGEQLALLDGSVLTCRRTAAAAALAADYLARKDARTLLIVGAGRVGAELYDAFSAIRPIGRVLVWNPTEARGQKLAETLRGRGVMAGFVSDLASAVGEADIISCATLAQEPVIRGEWLKPGQHLDLIGSFTPEMREADDAAIARGRLFIDTDAAKVESGDVIGPMASGALSAEAIGGTLYDLCAGKPGRLDDEEITIFKGVGVAIEDLAAAMVAWERLAQG